MRVTQAGRYARWSAWTAALLTLIAAGAYTRHAWQEHLEHNSMPSSVPSSVQDRAAGFSFSKVEGDRTIFTVRASRATQFQGGGRDLLEDVWMTLYGRDGERFDNMHTRACDFVTATGEITCAGEVQMDLQRADAAHRVKSAQSGGPVTAPPANPDSNIDPETIHVLTSHLSFNRDTGIAITDQPVAFRFPQGEGNAVGARYDLQQAEWHLLHDVKLKLHPRNDSTTSQAAAVAPIEISGSALTYREDERMMHLLGPVEADQDERKLTSGKLDVDLDDKSRASRIVAGDHARFQMTSGATRNAGFTSVVADQFSAMLSPGGSVERGIAVGNVHADAKNATNETHLDAERADVEFAGDTNQPRRLTATGQVVAQIKRTGTVNRASTGRLATTSLVIDFAPETSPQRADPRIDRAVTPAATIDWQDAAEPSVPGASGKPDLERIHATSKQLEAQFGSFGAGANELSELHGIGGVDVQRQIGTSPIQTSVSREAVAHFDSVGEWSTVDQTGDVRFHEGDQSARSDHAHFDRASDTVSLTGSMELLDASSRTTAQSGTFRESGNEFRAEGSVATTDLTAGSGQMLNLGSGLAHIVADRLQVDTSTNRYTYSGHARLWQGDALVQSDLIEIDRPTQVLTAIGQVRAVFPQASWQPSASASGTSSAVVSKPATRPTASGKQQEFWRAEAGRMTYDSGQGRGRLELGANAKSNEGTIRSNAMDLFFAPENRPESASPSGSQQASPQSASANSRSGPPTTQGHSASGQASGGGGQQLTRATAFGDVVVDQEDRRGTSDRADYDAAEGEFVLSGGKPIVHDSLGNSTTGRQLTLFFADDKILVDAEEGSRALTLHRVEK